MGNLIPLSHASALTRADIQKQIKTDPDPVPLSPSELDDQSLDEENSPAMLANQVLCSV